MRYFEVIIGGEDDDTTDERVVVHDVSVHEARMSSEVDRALDAREARTGKPALVWRANPTNKWVNAYRISRHYGGAEEGGWYYDIRECLASVPCADALEVTSVQDMLTRNIGWEANEYAKRHGGARFTVNGGSDFLAAIESERAESEKLEGEVYA